MKSITAPNFAFHALQFGGGSHARAPVVSTAVDGFTLEAWVRWDGGPIGTTGQAMIAANPSGGEGLIGAIDEVRVWDVARTSAQIAQDYNAALLGPEPDLIAYYKMDEGSGSGVADSAGNRPISLFGMWNWVTSGALLATAQR